MAVLLINTPEPMAKVRVIAIKDQSRKILETLQELGVLHVEEASELKPIDREHIEDERRRIREALGLLDDIISYLPEPQKVYVGDAGEADTVSRVIAEVDKLHRSLSQLIESYSRIREESLRAERLDRFLGELAKLANPHIKDLQYSGNYLYSNVIVLSQDTYSIFEDKTKALLLRNLNRTTDDGTVVCYFVAGADSRKQIETMIKDLGIATLDIPESDLDLSTFLAQNREDIQKLRSESERLRRDVQNSIMREIGAIALYREILTIEFGRCSVLLQAAEARYVTLIEGWIPEIAAPFLESKLKDASNNVFVETTSPGPNDLPPTKLRNPKAIQPFEVIVKLFSLPKYGDWDPTPGVAYFFAFFFGLMLNDLVYALGLLFLARFVLHKLVEDPDSEGTRLFRKVLYTSGSAALVVSLLSGTYLGDFPQMYLGIDLESTALIKTVQEALADPIYFIILSLIVGIVHVNLAHLLGAVRAIKEGDRGTVINKAGLLLIQLFGIPYIMQVMFKVRLIPVNDALYGIFPYFVLLGVVLLIIGSLIKMGGLGSFIWIFDLTGILGDIMSYSRLAGVGLATFYLASAFNLLSKWIAEIADSLLPGIAGAAAAFLSGLVLLLIFHVFNLFLSSLAAFIHSLRLCFVEYLLKFYEGGGREYTPFRMQFRREVLLGK